MQTACLNVLTYRHTVHVYTFELKYVGQYGGGCSHTYILFVVHGTAKQLFQMCCFEIASKLTDVLSFQLQVYMSVFCVCVVLTLLRTFFLLIAPMVFPSAVPSPFAR